MTDVTGKTGSINAFGNVTVQGKSGNKVEIKGDIAGDSVSLLNAKGNVGTLTAKALTVGNSPSSNIDLNVNNAVLSGDSEEVASSIYEGVFNSFTYDSTAGSLAIYGGKFHNTDLTGSFTHSGGGSLSVLGGSFDTFTHEDDAGSCSVGNSLGDKTVIVKGNSTNANLDTVNTLLGYVETGNSVTIDYKPTGLVKLTEGYTFANTDGGSATLILGSELDTGNKVTGGLVVDKDTDEGVVNVVFGTGVSTDSRIFVTKGSTLTTNTDLTNRVYKIEDDNTMGGLISATSSGGTYSYTYPSVVLSSSVDLGAGYAIISESRVFDSDGQLLVGTKNNISYGFGTDVSPNSYYYINETGSTIQVKGEDDYNPSSSVGYFIVKENELAIADIKNVAPNFVGFEAIRGIGNSKHSTGDIVYYFKDSSWKYYKYARTGGSWALSESATQPDWWPSSGSYYTLSYVVGLTSYVFN